MKFAIDILAEETKPTFTEFLSWKLWMVQNYFQIPKIWTENKKCKDHRKILINRVIVYRCEGFEWDLDGENLPRSFKKYEFD